MSRTKNFGRFLLMTTAVAAVFAGTLYFLKKQDEAGEDLAFDPDFDDDDAYEIENAGDGDHSFMSTMSDEKSQAPAEKAADPKETDAPAPSKDEAPVEEASKEEAPAPAAPAAAETPVSKESAASEAPSTNEPAAASADKRPAVEDFFNDDM